MATDSLSNDDFRSLSRQPPQDPDIQNTLSDFLTYTEHFPSHLTRALTLIGQQRAKSEQSFRQIHRATTQYALLPSLPANERASPTSIRRAISYALEEAERACRMAVEESVRLDDMARKESQRLDSVTEKLKAQPMPPSRDPTPEQTALTSPNLKREDRLSARGTEEKTPRNRHNKAESKLRGRRIMVPGEVLPPPDPNAPVEVVSPWSSPRASPPLEQPPASGRKATPRPRSRTPKLPKSEKRDRKDRDRDRDKEKKPRLSRQPGQPGTNAHSAVAGISTSNALLALTPPPDSALNGSKWLPWMKLTEWEMAKLRKRMKKNAIWVPSHTMVRRELKNLGRGVAGKEAAKKAADEGGPSFVDEANEADPTKIVVSGEESNEASNILANEYGIGEDETGGGADEDEELINRGMRLNEAKKLKRIRMLEEQALQQQLAAEQGIDLPTSISDSKNTEADGKRKRKRDSSPKVKDADVNASQAPQKKLKIMAPSTSAASQKVPLALTAASVRKAATPPPASTTGRKPTIILKSSMKAVSEEPPSRRTGLRRGSNASLPGAAASTTLPSPVRALPTGRRSRRPAPGLVTAGDGESAKVSSSKRKAAPRKKAQQQQQQQQLASSSSTALSSQVSKLPHLDGTEEPEPIDPNEPRYCVCGDVSWGTMIACDNEDNCEKEWFHLSCVNLDDLPPRRTKWYCPDCRKKLKLGINTNGLVGRNIGGSTTVVK
ncbi:hypothetical protein K431DRAFT_285020 [Polychaeton citri CBS 116435]|uniref:PHD-type domain-containing protein n=1 Tax=Polychaeton citri CBS 116435 TaxID=1314669 RepID=A0A9P4UMF4_9PEZI|nr:hypothetical protein K431DRAFT_285020 [Polychaeton citri CBS 116435]